LELQNNVTKPFLHINIIRISKKTGSSRFLHQTIHLFIHSYMHKITDSLHGFSYDKSIAPSKQCLHRVGSSASSYKFQ